MTRRRLTGTWQDLKLAPTTLVRMVVEGKARVVGKDRFGRNIYKLTARKAA